MMMGNLGVYSHNFFMQKNTQPSQNRSEGDTFPALYYTGVLLLFGEYLLD